MEFTPRISLTHATENRRLPAQDLQFPHLERCVNLWTNVDGVLEAPLPDANPPDPPDPPCPITTPVTSYVDFVTIGAYVVALGANGEYRRIWWSAPARPTVWALTEDLGTPPVTVKTGAGWNDLAGDGDILDHSNYTLGASAAIYDSQGVGQLSLTGNWGMPFAYAKKVNSIVSYSQGFASEVDGTHYFLDQTGLLYGTDAATVACVDGAFSLTAILGGGWPPYDEAQLWYDADIQKLWAYETTSALYFLIDAKTGNYTTKDTTADEYFQTGGLGMSKDDHAVHIQYVDFDAYVATSCSLKLNFAEIGGSWQPDIQYTLPAGHATTRLFVNQMVESDPQMKATLVSRSGKVNLYGFTVAHDDGGRR